MLWSEIDIGHAVPSSAERLLYSAAFHNVGSSEGRYNNATGQLQPV